MRAKGQGTFDKGYKITIRDGVRVREHVEVAERAIGRKLPLGAIVHHHDENTSNNVPSNLVICPDIAYHKLLHRRMRALAASGDANNRICSFCKRWDSPLNLREGTGGGNRRWTYHVECRKAYRMQKATVEG